MVATPPASPGSANCPWSSRLAPHISVEPSRSSISWSRDIQALGEIVREGTVLRQALLTALMAGADRGDNNLRRVGSATETLPPLSNATRPIVSTTRSTRLRGPQDWPVKLMAAGNGSLLSGARRYRYHPARL